MNTEIPSTPEFTDTERKCKGCFFSLNMNDQYWCTAAVWTKTTADDTCEKWRERKAEHIETVRNDVKAPQIPKRFEPLPDAVKAQAAAYLADMKQAFQTTNNETIFTKLQEQIMQGFIGMVWNHIRILNPKTTAVGLVALITHIVVAIGWEITPEIKIGLTTVFYTLFANYASVNWTWQKIVGVVLMVASFALNPILGAAGFTLSAPTILIVQGFIDQIIGGLLQDARETLRPSQSSNASLAAPILAFFLLFASASAFAQENRIPTQFQVFSRTITVKYDSAYCEKHNAWGTYHHREALIRLNNSDNPDKDGVQSTFYHELTHCILEHIERNDLSRNERFVALFSRVLMQALATRRYSSQDFSQDSLRTNEHHVSQLR